MSTLRLAVYLLDISHIERDKGAQLENLYYPTSICHCPKQFNNVGNKPNFLHHVNISLLRSL